MKNYKIGSPFNKGVEFHISETDLTINKNLSTDQVSIQQSNDILSKYKEISDNNREKIRIYESKDFYDDVDVAYSEQLNKLILTSQNISDFRKLGFYPIYDSGVVDYFDSIANKFYNEAIEYGYSRTIDLPISINETKKVYNYDMTRKSNINKLSTLLRKVYTELIRSVDCRFLNGKFIYSSFCYFDKIKVTKSNLNLALAILNELDLIKYRDSAHAPFRGDDGKVKSNYQTYCRTWYIDMSKANSIKSNKFKFDFTDPSLNSYFDSKSELEQYEIINNLKLFPSTSDIKLIKSEITKCENILSNNKSTADAITEAIKTLNCLKTINAYIIKDLVVLVRSSRDSFAGRLYTTLTRIKKDFRQSMTLQTGEPTIELDMPSNELTLLFNKFNGDYRHYDPGKEFTGTDTFFMFKHGDLYTYFGRWMWYLNRIHLDKFCYELDINSILNYRRDFIKIAKPHNIKDSELDRDVVKLTAMNYLNTKLSTTFYLKSYRTLINKLQNGEDLTEKEYDFLEQCRNLLLFATAIRINSIGIFHEIESQKKLYKETGNKTDYITYINQNSEVNMMEPVWKELMKQKKFFISIHDSIKVRLSDVIPTLILMYKRLFELDIILPKPIKLEYKGDIDKKIIDNLNRISALFANYPWNCDLKNVDTIGTQIIEYK